MNKILSILLVFVSILSSAPACASNQDAPTRHPKLSSHLWHLIDAEKQGEAAPFASRRNIELLNGGVKVRVRIICLPGQVEAIATVVAAVGIVEIVNTNRNAIQAIVPIPSLITLADEKGVQSIRLPRRPKEGTKNQNK